SDDVGAAVLGEADGAQLWGSEQAIAAVRQQCPADAVVATYGPRRSSAIVVLEADDVADVANRIAIEATAYDQQACLSPLRFYVALEVADAVARGGGSRVVELGLARHPRRGFVHDGARALHSLVRWVSVEDDLTQGSRYSSTSPPELRAELDAFAREAV